MRRTLVLWILISLMAASHSTKAQNKGLQLEALDSLGEYYFTQNQLDSSAFYHRQALSLAGELSDETAQLNAYNWLFVLHYYQGHTDSMRLLLDVMTPLAEQIAPETPEAYNSLSGFWGYKAFYHYSQGELAQNVAAARRSLELFRQQPAYDTSELAILYQNLGTALEEIGEYDQANTYSRQALKLLRPSPLRTNIQLDSLRIINSIGVQLIRLQRYERADSFFRSGVDLAYRLSKLPDREVRSSAALYFLQWGSGAFQQQAYQEAELRYRRAQQILDRLPEISDVHALALRYRARNALEQGQLANAAELAQKADKLIETHFPDRRDQRAATARLQGEIYLAQGESLLALTSLQEALHYLCPDFQSDDPPDNPPVEAMSYSRNDLLQILQSKAKALQLSGQVAAGFATYELAIDLYRHMREDYVTETSRLFLAGQTKPLFGAAVSTALGLDKTEAAWQLAAQSKALLLLETLADEEAYRLARVPTERKELLQGLHLKRNFWEEAIYDAKVSDDSLALVQAQDELFALREDLYLAQEALRSEYPRFFELKYGKTPPSIIELQMEQLSPGSALIDYFVTDDEVILFGLTHYKLYTATINKDADFSVRINRLLQSLRLEGPNDPAQYARDAFAVYAHYLAPILNQFEVPVEQLLIVPDGPFHYLPFEALLTAPPMEAAYSQLPYLLRQYHCTYAYSSTLLTESPGYDPSGSGTFVGFAPSFDGEQAVAALRSQLGPLRYNIEAVESIRSLTGGISYSADRASRANLFQPAYVPRVLHLSTHAIMDDENPLGSRIFLADGAVTTREIYELPYQAQLVVLSACETGTGKYYQGEGMMSLARAFAQSGTPSVVTSLWQVDDRSTSELMVAFYRHLIRGKSKDEALRNAKLDFLSGKESEILHHPYYWAAFVHIGDPQALAFRRGISYWFYGGVIAILLVVLIIRNRRRSKGRSG